MGLWNFIKESGTSLFGSSAEAAEAPAADALTAGVQALGLDTSGVTVTVDGDKVKVSGTAVTPEMQEKVILALGNVAGVASVEADVAGPAPVFYTVVKGDTLSIRRSSRPTNRCWPILTRSIPARCSASRKSRQSQFSHQA
jgi:nucleoid-associated protein YgaU